MQANIDMIKSYLSLGDAYQANNDFEGTERSYKRALQTSEQLFGHFSEEVGLVLVALEGFYGRRNEYENLKYIRFRIRELVDDYNLDA